MSKIPYRAEIDGLRAVSVLAVILFHFSPKLLPGGFMGVDVFFVISGYLITSIILASQLTGQPWLGGFWRRRLQRIFPALAVMVLLVLALVLIIGLPSLIANTGKQAVSVFTFVANYRMLAISGNYWGASADYTVLLHTWSLAVEEQFYFIYPLLLALVLARLGMNGSRWVLVILFLLSLFWCFYQTKVNQAAAFYLLPARAWELIAGALIAFFAEKINFLFSKTISRLLSNLGLCLILGSFFFLPGKFEFPGFIALVPVLGAVLYISFSSAGGLASEVLSLKPSLIIGKASYSLYLWHWPMLVLGLFFAKFYEMESLRLIGILLGIGLGFASYKWVEPLGKSPYFLRILAPAGATLLLGTSVFLAFSGTNPYQEKFKKDWRGQKFDALVERETPFLQRAFRGLSEGEIQWPHQKVSSEKKIDVILLGDSHALSLANSLYNFLETKDYRLAVFAVGGWTLAPVANSNYIDSSAKKAFYDSRKRLIGSLQPKLIIISARWENIKSAESLLAVGDFISEIRSLSPRTQIIVIGQPPVIDYAQYSGIYAHEWLNWRHRMKGGQTTFPIMIQPSFINTQQYIERIVLKDSNLKFLSTFDFFPITNHRVDAVKDGQSLYYDGDHLSEAGATLVVNKIGPEILDILNKSL